MTNEKKFLTPLELFAKKMDRNRFYYPPVSNIFYFYDPGEAKRFTEEGRKALKEIMKEFSKPDFQTEQ